MPGITIETVGDLIDHHMTAAVYRAACQRGRDVDLEALAAKVGRDWIYVGARWPFRCQCGSRDNTVKIAPVAPGHP